MGRRGPARLLLAVAALNGLARGVFAAPGNGRVAVFLERGFPYFNANEMVSPRALAEGLRKLSVEVDLVSATELADPNAFCQERYAVLVMVSGNTFPEGALANLKEFRRAGGAVVATGVPFTHPCFQEAVENGRRAVPSQTLWRDRGHHDHTGPDGMATGQVRFMGEPVVGFTVPPEDPLGLGERHGVRSLPGGTAQRPLWSAAVSAAAPKQRLRHSREGTARRPFPTTSRTTAVLAPETIGSRRWRPGLVAHGRRDSGPAVALIEAGEGVGPTALVGVGHFSDAREPAEVIVQQQLVLRGVGWCLAQMGLAVPADFNARCGELAPDLPPEEPVPNPSSPPPARLFPQPPPPTPRLTVLDVSGLSRDEQLLSVSIQGLVNRRKPRIYLIHDRYDREWLDWLRTNGLTGEPEVLADLEDLVSKFRRSLRGAVVTDERWINIACMVASVRNLAILTPELIGEYAGRGTRDAGRVGNWATGRPEATGQLGDWAVRQLDRIAELPNCRITELSVPHPSSLIPHPSSPYQLPVVMDLREQGWERDLEGYAWARAELWPHLNHRLLGHVSPHSSHTQRDFLIAQRAFLFWIPGALDGSDEGADPLESLLFARKIFAETPPLTPVCGWWGWGDPYEGIGEYWGMTLASRYGKLTPGTEFASNLSVHSAIRVPERLLTRRVPLRQGPALRPDRTYVAMDVLDSGDAVWYCQRRQRDVWADEARGKAPIGWSFTPSLLDFAPAVAAYYQQQATDHDELMAAVSGLMYCSLREYGQAFQRPEEVRRQYLEASGRAMRRLGLDTLIAYIDHWGAPTDFGDGGIMAECARAMPGLKALFPDLGRPDEVSYGNANYVLAERVPVFHCLTRWRPWTLAADVANRTTSPEVAWLLAELREQVPAGRGNGTASGRGNGTASVPYFVSAFPLSWTMPPRAIREVVQALPPDHEAVLPSELGRLFVEFEEETE